MAHLLRSSLWLSPRFALILRIVAISVVLGAGIGLARSPSEDLVLSAAIGSLIGALISIGCACAEVFVFSNTSFRFARVLPPALLMLLRAATYVAVILLGLSFPSLLLGEPRPWDLPGFWPMFFSSVGIAFTFSLATETIRLLGTEATMALVTGRYTRPRLEERVVMFADIAGSTELAERIGELAFHRFLRDVFLDLAPAIEATRGDVYRYIGDAVIVTWPIARGLENGNCLRCADHMHARLASRAAFYQRRYDVDIKLRVALHSGEVAAGEIGDWKKEIALLGDVMNSTARMESATKTYDVATALSDTLVKRLPEAYAKGLRRLPDFAAKGKSSDLALWTPDPVA